MTDTSIQTATVSSSSTAPQPRSSGGARVQTVVIGAGQAGLATAYHLGLAGHECVVLDRNRRVGDQWRRRYDSLVLNTPARCSGLPGLPFPARGRTYPTAVKLADYHEEYTRRFGISFQGGVTVSAVEQVGNGWRVSTDRGTYVAENVVVATGGETHPRVPDVRDLLDPGIRQLHASDYHNPDDLLPGPVLVVGLGQSGADIALELARAGHDVHTSGAVRQEVPIDITSFLGRIVFRFIWFAWNHVLTERTPPGRKLKAGIRSGRVTAPLIRVKRRHLDAAGVQRHDERTTGAAGGRPQLDDGTVLDVTNVVWCTGYRQDFSFIRPSPVAEDGWPRDASGVMKDLPGLYFMGLLFQRGFYSMLIGGAGRDAKFIARQILRRSRVHAPSAA